MGYDEKTKEILGKNIWRRREVLGLSREQLEKKVEVSRGVVSDWEKGKYIPARVKIKLLSKALRCSINDLFSEQRMTVLNHASAKVVEEADVKKDVVIDDVVVDEPTVEATVEVNKDVLRVSDKLNKYIEDNNISIYALSKNSGVSNGTIWRVQNKKTSYTNKVKELEAYLDNIEVIKEPIIIEPINEPVEPTKEPLKTDITKGSISDRLEIIYNTLFNSLAELDELKQDIAKIEKVTTLLKQIDL